MIQLPPNEDVEILSDWAELSCLFHESRDFLPRTEVETIFEQAGLADPEFMSSEIWREIDRRHSLAGDKHPIAVEQHRLKCITNWRSALAYSFQLLISNHLNYPVTRLSPAEWNLVAKLFEKLVTAAITRYVGRTPINIGSPRETPLPTGFADALDHLCSSIFEARGSDRSLNDVVKDDDLDIAAWIPFGDSRPSQLMLFVQCAAGRTDWRSKTTTLALDLWQDYIDWHVPPVRGFAFPFVPFEDTDWRRLSKEGGVLFDRLRITALYQPALDTHSDLESQITHWCQDQVNRLPNEE